MMAHESTYHEEAGAVVIWTHRDLQCRVCGYMYDNINGEDAYCQACGSEEQYDILDEYFD